MSEDLTAARAAAQPGPPRHSDAAAHPVAQDEGHVRSRGQGQDRDHGEEGQELGGYPATVGSAAVRRARDRRCPAAGAQPAGGPGSVQPAGRSGSSRPAKLSASPSTATAAHPANSQPSPSG